MRLKFATILTILLFVIPGASAQVDSVIFKNENFVVGEIKGMDKGVLTIETDYSENDFEIEWSGIKEIYTETTFLITLSDGRRYNGQVSSAGTEPGQIQILRSEGGEVQSPINQLVYLNSVDDSFLSRLSATIDMGFSFTKARNLRQYNMSSSLGYLAERWVAGANYSFVASTQDEVDPIRRGDGGFNFQWFLPKDWYSQAQLNFLSSTELLLDLRTTTKLGMGKYIIHTNATYWGVVAGLNFNNENYTDAPGRKSLEGYIGSELNMYDVGDLSLTARAVAYPSFTESGRWRMDLGLDSKYDLPLDFYIRLGYTLNYDNQPTEGSGTTDYTVQIGAGWEW